MTKVDKIRELLQKGEKQIDIAEALGTTQAYVSQVNCGTHTRIARRKRQAERDRLNNTYSRLSFDKRKKKARKAGREFSIKWEDLDFPTHCPILGIELDYSGQSDLGVRPCLERIDNTLSYKPGNVWIISTKANTEKGSLTLEEFTSKFK
jgi:transcriptional regulator with XRE-family HTH domain